MFGYMFWNNTATTNFEKKQIAENFTNQTRLSENIVKDDKPVEELFPFGMKENQIQTAIHFMSHQKVKAEEKWGAIRITPERINRLKEIIETNQKDYKHASLYLSILNRWDNGDFSRADDDHNAIWKLQNGNIGEATRVLSPKEEQKFVEEHFE
ncbi:DUF6241 domain-containing protein [Bacillus sp. AK128]